MKWWGRSAAAGRVAPSVDEGDRSPRTEIVGVSGEPGHSVERSLYEFWTTEGVPVRLHDATLISIEVRPVDRKLVVRFDYDDPQWIPPEAVEAPVIMMEFEDATVSEWIQDSTDVDDDAPAEVNGQVSDFAHFNGNEFLLTTYQSEIQFTAAKLTVRLRPREA